MSDTTTINSKNISRYYDNYRPEMLEFVPIEAKRILEVGCGEGRFGQAVKEKNKAVIWGVELNIHAAKKARKILNKVLIGDIQDQIKKLPKAYFDCAVFNDILEHLPNPEWVLKQIQNRIKPGGWIVCSIPNVLHMNVLKGLLLDRDWKYMPAGILDETHLRFYTYKSIQRMFKNLGFSIELIKGINPYQSKKFEFLNFLTFHLFEETGYFQYACVVKTPQLKKS